MIAAVQDKDGVQIKEKEIDTHPDAADENEESEDDVVAEAGPGTGALGQSRIS
jgi:hypothetical protein